LFYDKIVLFPMENRSALDAHSNVKTVKVVVVGEAEVGKTCLLIRYVENSYDPTPSTVDIDMKAKMITDPDGKTVKYAIWDTAGQERFRSITSSLFHGVSGVIVACDISSAESFEKIESWLELVKQYIFADTPILLVGNKSDLESSRCVKLSDATLLGKKYDLEYMEASAKTGNGVNEAFQRLADIIFQRQAAKDGTKKEKAEKPRRGSIVKPDSPNEKPHSKGRSCQLI